MLNNTTSTEAQNEAPTKKKRYVTKTVYAPMMELGAYKTTQVQVGTRMAQQRETLSIFSTKARERKMVEVEVPVLEERNEWVPNGKYSDCQIDHRAMARLTEEAMNKLDADGYEVLSVTPWDEGNYNWNTDPFIDHSHIPRGNQLSGSYGYGYSFTRGMMICAKLRD
jgi:hypothetical protein